MIIDNTYFKNEIFIAHAKPGITDDVTAIEGDILEFIADYSRRCLLKSLGSPLFYEFEATLDIIKADGLKDGANAKWDDLLNGKTYEDPISEKNVTWRGIRYKNISTGNYNRSFIANYVYFYWERDNHITSSDAGHSIEEPANALMVSPNHKVIKSWREFYKLVQGENTIPTILRKNGMFGLDYYVGGEDVSLYKFIKDSNEIITDTYKDFDPKTWVNLNQMNI